MFPIGKPGSELCKQSSAISIDNRSVSGNTSVQDILCLGAVPTIYAPFWHKVQSNVENMTNIYAVQLILSEWLEPCGCTFSAGTG
jgi:hypothetical protein